MTLVKLRRSDVNYAATGRMITRYASLNGISIPELAEQMRCSRQTIMNWMSGKSLPSVKRFNELAELFGVYPIDIICILSPEWKEEQ